MKPSEEELYSPAIFAVRDINLSIHEQINMDDESSIPFLEYYTDGFSSIIKFMDNIIWASEDDTRRSGEILEDCLKRIITDMLTNCRNINIQTFLVRRNILYIFCFTLFFTHNSCTLLYK